ncbi:MAG: trypsin-like peptidase domain-containing protein [Bacilli bacterium]|nr:trypsin-like peptidase domain-containing protein [Bacilli bacterium]
METNFQNEEIELPSVKKTNDNSMGKTVLLVIVTAVISAGLGAGGLLLFFHYFPEYVSYNITNLTKTEKEVTINENGIADAVDKIYDSVVIVKTYKNNQLYATGTGFVYKNVSNKYYFITNYHVIEDGDKIAVVFTDGEESVVNVEQGDKFADIAVLSYKTDKDIKVSEIGNSSESRVGDTVFAIGAPLDSSVYSWSVTRGILSGKDREVEVSLSNSSTSDWIMQVLQTDAAINSGNSGGPLCNSNGQVIGVTNMKLITTGVEGMGFAIPIEEAASYADKVINGEDTSRPLLGVTMSEASIKANAKAHGLQPIDGVLIEEISKGSPAEKAGLKRSDVIVAMNDVFVTNIASLRYQLYKYKVGDTITIKYIRDGKEQNTKLTLTSSN